MKMKFFLGFLLFFGGKSALADNPPPVPANNPCMKDIHKYCRDVVPGEGRLAHCMRQHASLLSAGCKKFGEDYEKKHPGIGKKAGSGKKKK